MDDRSIMRMRGVNSALVNVMLEAHARLAASGGSLSFIITEGLRTKERQAQLVKAGASQTMNSKHLTGRAVDVAATIDGDVRWDWPLYHKLSVLIKQVAKDKGVSIVWGGDWRKLKDGPHYELEG